MTESPDQFWMYPTLLENFLSCQKRTEFRFNSKTKNLDRMSTRSAVGIAVHRTINRLHRREPFEEAWLCSVNETYAEMLVNWNPAEVPKPENWERFFILKARLLKRFNAGEFESKSQGTINSQGKQRVTDSGFWVNQSRPGPLPWIEKALFDVDEGFKGIPDQVVEISGAIVVIDHKTGENQSEPTTSQRRQLLFYAWLVERNLGRMPTRGEIRTSRNSSFWFPIQKSDVLKVIEQARFARDVILAAGNGSKMDLPASASAENCSWCMFRPSCNDFLISVDEAWNVSPVVRGRVVKVDHQQDWYAIDLEVELPEWHQKNFRITNLRLADAPEIGAQMAFADYSIRGNTGYANWNTLSFTWDEN